MAKRTRRVVILVGLLACEASVFVACGTTSLVTGTDGGADGSSADGKTASDGGSDSAALDGAITDASLDGLAPDGCSTVTRTLFWTESNVVRAATVDGQCVTTIVEGGFTTGVALDSIAAKIYWGDNISDTVSRANYDGTGIETLHKDIDAYSNPTGVALDHAANQLFWTETGVVYAASLSGADASVIFTGTFPVSAGVDTQAEQLYFTDNGTDTVNACAYDGGSPVVLYMSANPLSNPTSVAVAPAHGYVFFCQLGGVYRMATDGGDLTMIADAMFPQGIAVDESSERIFFTENSTDTITRASFDGGGAVVIYKNTNPFSNPFGIAVRAQ